MIKPIYFICLHPSLTDRLRPGLLHFFAAMSQNDVIESADTAQPLTQRLADASVGHVAGELAEAGVERRLERQEGGI